uniref:Uncharacterized protein LOC114326887 n=1 Tax=Diabrotica virgifera virgifera TaxID=50390 RepID=A0A6P7FCH6_DIAVI
MESDFYGTQKQIWRFIRNQRKEMAELKEYNNTPANEWESYLTELIKEKENNQNNNLPELRHEIEISFQEVEIAINSLKHRNLAERSPGKMAQTRWFKTANRILRVYVARTDPCESLKILPEFMIQVYSRMRFEIKTQPRLEYGARHL